MAPLFGVARLTVDSLCGRYAQRFSKVDVAGRILGLPPLPGWVPSRFDIPPGIGILAMIAGPLGGLESVFAKRRCRSCWAQPDAQADHQAHVAPSASQSISRKPAARSQASSILASGSGSARR